MKRREFIKITSAAGAAVATGVAAPVEAKELSPDQMNDYVGRLDRHLDAISRQKTIHDLVPNLAAPHTEDQRAAMARGDELFRKSLRSLLVVGVMHDLPEPSRLHPAMQERLWNALPEMDDAVFGTLDFLGSLTPADRIDIEEAIEKDPDLPMRIIESIDREGAAIGVSAKRRLHLRTLGAQVAWRMRRQSASAVIGEYVEKAEKAIARHPANLEALKKLAARYGENALFGLQEGMARGTLFAAAGNEVTYAPGEGPPPPGAPIAPPVDPRAWNRQSALQKQQVGQRTMTAGGWMLGIGAVVTGVFTALTVTQSIWFAFGITAGVILVIAGIVCLIVGAVVKARAESALEQSS